MKSRIRTLVIGLGRIASTLEKDPLRFHPCTHAGVLLSEAGKRKFHLSGIIDHDQRILKEFGRFWNIDFRKLVTNIDQIKNSGIEFAVIATNSESHFEIAKFCLQCGIKNLLIEKPACLCVSEISELIRLKKKMKASIWVNHERRYHPVYSHVKDLIDTGKIGRIVTIRASVFTSSAIPGNAFRKDSVGPLLHDGTHTLDYVQWILGRPKKISAKKNNERIHALLEYPDNIIVFFETGKAGNYFQFEIDIITTDARIILSNDGHQFFRSRKSNLYKGFYSLSPERLPVFPRKFRNPWINLYEEISGFILNTSREITGPIEDSREILQMIAGIESSAKNSLH